MLKRGLLLAGLLTLTACSQAPVSLTESTGLTTQRISTAEDDQVVDVAVHKGSGSIYALSNTSSLPTDTGPYSSDVFLRRYNRSGAVVWSRQLGPDNSATAGVLATDSSSNIFVQYNDQLEKRRSDGSLIWSRTVLGISALEADQNGNVYVGGSVPEGSLFLSKYTAAGSRTWTRSVQALGIYFQPNGVATDSSGNVYLAASDYDDCCLRNALLKYSPSGQLLINKKFSASSGEVDLSDVVVVGNALYLAGNAYADWGDADPDFPNQPDSLLIKTSLSGSEQWRRVFGTAEPDVVRDLATDTSGGLYLTGYTFGNLGGVQPRGSDAFLSKYSSSGVALWTKQIGSAGADYGNAVVAYSSNEIYLGGEAGGALIGSTYRGGQDGFLRRTDGQGNRVWTDQ